MQQLLDKPMRDIGVIDDMRRVHISPVLLAQLVQDFAVLFQVLLQKLKQILFGASSQIVRVHIRILEDLPTKEDLVVRVLQELDIDPRFIVTRTRIDLRRRMLLIAAMQIRFDFAQHFMRRLGQELLALLVVVIAIEVVHKLVELFVLALLQFLLVAERRLRLVFVAAIVSASADAVLFPRAHAHPTKLKLALGAHHMIAAVVALDARQTLWALFGVGHNPLRVVALFHALQLPLLELRARGRRMVFLQARETKIKTASTLHKSR
mmetsp:Transcript_46631/g.77465  ORF Transcript_46631/g.77465 Transcript_46631/m.77465 type:complete len:265 (+) Transcript_46631:70-864(+)